MSQRLLGGVFGITAVFEGLSKTTALCRFAIKFACCCHSAFVNELAVLWNRFIRRLLFLFLGTAASMIKNSWLGSFFRTFLRYHRLFPT